MYAVNGGINRPECRFFCSITVDSYEISPKMGLRSTYQNFILENHVAKLGMFRHGPKISGV